MSQSLFTLLHEEQMKLSTIFQFVLICIIILGIVGYKVPGSLAAAKPAPTVPAPSPTVRAYGGKFPYQLDENGLFMTMVALPITFPGEYVVTLTQQGSASMNAAADEFNGIFSVDRMFTDTFVPGFFVAGLQGEPGATGWVQWIAAPVEYGAGVE